MIQLLMMIFGIIIQSFRDLGAATGALLVARGGRRAMARQAMIGGVLLALIEGLNIFISNTIAGSADPARNMQVAAPPPVSQTLSGTATPPPFGAAAAPAGF